MLGMTLGSLNALIDNSFVKMGCLRNSKSESRYVYVLTTRRMAEKVALISRFLKRKMEEYDALNVEIGTLKIEVGEGKGNSQA